MINRRRFNNKNVIKDENNKKYRIKKYISVNNARSLTLGIYPDAQDSWEIDYYFNTADRTAILGGWSTGGASLENAYGSIANGNIISIYYDNQQAQYNAVYMCRRFILKADKNIIYVNGEKIAEFEEKTDNQASRVFYVGAINGTTAGNGGGRIYSFKYWKHGELIYDLVPVQSVETNKYGFFNKINNKVYYSNGTYDFIGA